MPGAVCPFHSDEWSIGTHVGGGSYAYECQLRDGHPGRTHWRWLDVPTPQDVHGVSGLAEELGLDVELPAAVAALGPGWYEYGLVERSYAERRPQDFARMVAQWGHTALGPRQYSVSSYLGRTLGALSRVGSVAYHPGVGTGRWSYNTDISWWSTVPAGPWDLQTSWVEVVGDVDQEQRQKDLACRAYVPGPWS